MRIRPILRVAWRWSWLVTLPVTVAAFVWLRTTVARYRSFRVEQATLHDFRLTTVGRMTAGEMLRHLELDWTRLGGSPPIPGVRTLDVHAPDVLFARLDADLPHSGLEYLTDAIPTGGSAPPIVKKVWAMLGAGGDSWRVQLRYRGDNVYHWGYRKKSLRLRTDKDRLFEGMRAFNLIAPRTPALLNNYLAYRLAHRLGLIAPRVELAELRINGEARGLYVLTEQPDEATLRAHGRLVGDLYSGDAVAQGAYAGIDNDLFRYPELWEKQVADPRADPASRAPLAALLAVVNAPPSEARHARLRELIDVEAFARFSALELLCETIHVDTEHNWRLFFDPGRGRFVPVVWDLFGWDDRPERRGGAPPLLDVISSPLHAVLHADGAFLAARHRALAGFLCGGEAERFRAEVDAAIAAASAAVERDPDLTMEVRAHRPGEVRAAMAELRARIAACHELLAETYTRPRRPVRWWRTERGIAVVVDERVPVTALHVQLDRPAAEGDVKIRWRRLGETVEADVSAAVARRGSEVEIAVALPARHVLQLESLRTFEVRYNHAVIRPATYEVELGGVLPGAKVLDVRCARGPGPAETALEVAPEALVDLGPVWRAVEPAPVHAPQVWRGTIEVHATTEVAGPLVVEPGAVVRLAPGASLVLRGRLLARGTAEAPIRFEPVAQEPWGAVVLRGPGASGSQLAFCTLTGGRGWSAPLGGSPAMLAVHEARDVTLEHCTLADGAADDLLRAVYASVRARDCTFARTRGDAIDLDLAEASLERCSFEATGRDGVELSSGRAVVADCSFRACAGRAIAATGDSVALVLRSAIEGGAIAVQAIDGAAVAVVGGSVRGSACALDAGKRDWRFGAGGRLWVHQATFADNRRVAAADEFSAMLLRDCALDRRPPPSRGRIVVDGSDPGAPLRRDPEELRALAALDALRGDR